MRSGHRALLMQKIVIMNPPVEGEVLKMTLNSAPLLWLINYTLHNIPFFRQKYR